MLNVPRPGSRHHIDIAGNNQLFQYCTTHGDVFPSPFPFLSFPFLSCIRKHEKGSCSQTDYTRHNNSPNHYRVWSYTISSTISCFYGDKRLQCPSYIWSARYSFRKKHLGSSLVQKFVRPTGLRKIMNVILGLLLRLNRHAHYISFLSSHRFFVVFVILFW